MKKILIAFFALCMLLAGCTTTPASTPNLGATTPPTTTEPHQHAPEQTPPQHHQTCRNHCPDLSRLGACRIYPLSAQRIR